MNTLFSHRYPSDKGMPTDTFAIVEGGDGSIGAQCNSLYVKIPEDAYFALYGILSERLPTKTNHPAADPTSDPEAGGAAPGIGKGPLENDWHCGNAHLRDEWIARLITHEPRIAASAGWPEALDATAYTAGPTVIADLILRQKQGDIPF